MYHEFHRRDHERGKCSKASNFGKLRELLVAVISTTLEVMTSIFKAT